MLLVFGPFALADSTTTIDVGPISMAGANGITVATSVHSISGADLLSIVEQGCDQVEWQALKDMDWTAGVAFSKRLSATGAGTIVDTCAAGAASSSGGARNNVPLGTPWIRIRYKLSAAGTVIFSVRLNTFMA